VCDDDLDGIPDRRFDWGAKPRKYKRGILLWFPMPHNAGDAPETRQQERVWRDRAAGGPENATVEP